MRIIYYFTVFVLLLTYTSCEEDFVFVKNNFTPQIVVNSVFKPDHKWMVHVSTSRDMLDPASKIRNVGNANVVIVESVSKYRIYLKHIGEGMYSADYYPPLPDKSYELIVEVPGFKTVKAKSSAPQKANIVNVFTDLINEKVTNVKFQVKDDKSQFLIWNFITSKGSNGPIDTIYTGNPKSFIFGFYNYDNALSSYIVSGKDAVTNSGVFSGNFVEDSGSADNSSKDNNGSSNEESANNTEIKKYLRVVTASSNLYNYYKSVEKFLSAGNHNSSFSNSPQIYSNIENGLGIFAGYTEQLTEIE